MILDSLQHAHRYAGLNPRLCAAFEFLADARTAAMKPPAEGSANSLRVDLQGDDVFALVQRYRTKSPEEGFWEAHRRYIDVQCVIEGAENMGCAPLESMRITQPYDAEKDYVMLAPRRPEDVNYVCVPEGMFAIFMPHDAHFPGLAVGGKIASVKKIVVKVAV